MSRRLVLEATGFGVRAAVVENDALIEIHDADEPAAQVTDLLHLGRVTAIDQRLNAAFLDLGRGEPGFLLAKDARHGAGAELRQPIGKLLREGDRLVVQGLREAEGGKGPRVTTDLKLFGFHLLWRPHGGGPDTTQPARGAERQALQARGRDLFGEQAVALRRLATGVPDETLTDELAALQVRWARLQAGIEGRAKPGPLTGGEHPAERLLRTLVTPDLETIEVADTGLATKVASLLDGPLAPHGIALVRLPEGRSAFEETDVATALDQALARTIELPGGGRLTIEPTAAFVAVDVDGEGRGALETDLDAARALARLVRLRNLGGSIVVDFIDLSTKAHRQRLEEALKRAFRDDPVPVDIYPMSPLGIVQIGRARRGRSLDALLRRPCPACDGSGAVPSLRAQAEALLERLGGSARMPARVRAAPDLALHLQREAAALWQRRAMGTAVVADPSLGAGAFVLEENDAAS